MPMPGKILRGAQWGEKLAALMAPSSESAAAWMERHCKLLKRDDHSRVGLLVLHGQPCMLLLTEAIAGARDLRALWLQPSPPAVAERLMSAAGETLAGLHAAGYAHGDAKWSNLLWDGSRFYLVDLEAVRRFQA